uniref:response regulator transcription factor n=1 Tax=Nitrosomonas sp. TaxID=42353 RepID=UPI0035AF197A
WLGRSSFSAKQVQSKSYQSLTLPYANEIAACSRLSKAESLVASLACQGLSAKKIGSQLSITEKTVRNHLSVIYRKVGVRKQIELCIKAPLYSL